MSLALAPTVRMRLLGSRLGRQCARVDAFGAPGRIYAMTLGHALLLACEATYFTKLAGYAVSVCWLQIPRMARVAGAVTVTLLSVR